MSSEGLVTVNGGSQTRDFVYVKDTVKIALKSMELATSQPVCERVNVCTGRSTTISVLLDIIADTVGKTPDVEHRNLPPGDPEKSSGTCEKMCEIFSMSLEDFMPLERGLSETVKVKKE